MWGGVKARKTYLENFRQWSATKGLEPLRSSLYQEPRPWFMAFSIHECQHMLQDHHCARIMSWNTTILQLTKKVTQKQQVYRYAQETFGMLSNTHKVGVESLSEYMRLCAVGKDLSSAFDWYQYWVDTKKEGANSLIVYTWLLRLALVAPTYESAEDMAVAVKDAYSSHFCVPMEHEETGERVLSHFKPTNAEEASQLKDVFCAFRALLPRLADEELQGFVKSLPVDDADVHQWLAAGWPGANHHHVFPQLEHNLPTPEVSVRMPHLRDSILHPKLIRELEEAAFVAHDVSKVVALIKQYEERVVQERENQKRTGHARRSPQSDWKDDIWRQYVDKSAQQFRASLVQGGGLTPELYHYLIASLAHTQPTAALRTLKRMEACGLRVLDITRAIVLVAASGSLEDQLELFQQQLAEVQSREQLDQDFEVDKEVELYWKYQYTDFFHYRNALDMQAFYALLMDGIGIPALQGLLRAAQTHGPAILEEDLVIVDEPLRLSAAQHLRRQCGSDAVDHAMNVITNSLPKLDISLIGSVPHFSNYTLGDADQYIATDTKMLKDGLDGFEEVYVLDTSFVETCVGLSSLGDPNKKTLVLIPYMVLHQLGESVASQGQFVSFDRALQRTLKEEVSLASQRLRLLFSMLTPSPLHPLRTVRVLHHTECLLAQGLPTTVLHSLDLHPEKSDNDLMVLVTALLRTLAEAHTRVVLCTDDDELQNTIERCGAQLMPSPVDVLKTEAPSTVDTKEALIDDNPILDFSVAEFTPKLDFAHIQQQQQLSGEQLPSAGSVDSRAKEEAAGEPVSWLSMLDDDEPAPAVASQALDEQDKKGGALVAAAPPAELSVADVASSSNDIDLMNLYETPHDVVPIGVRMEEASAVSSVFEEFDTMEPDQYALREQERKARASKIQPSSGGKPPRRRSLLEREMLQNRGHSGKARLQMARRLSNMSGGRVPFNFRYKVVEANINDPRNKHLKSTYARSLGKKREHFQKTRNT